MCKASLKNVKTEPKQLRLDELGFSPKVAKVKVNLMLEERKGITVSVRTDDDFHHRHKRDYAYGFACRLVNHQVFFIARRFREVF